MMKTISMFVFMLFVSNGFVSTSYADHHEGDKKAEVKKECEKCHKDKKDCECKDKKDCECKDKKDCKCGDKKDCEKCHKDNSCKGCKHDKKAKHSHTDGHKHEHNHAIEGEAPKEEAKH